MASRLSVVINTLNEAKNLPAAVASVKGIAEEIVVVDMESDDGTPDIAKKLGARVFSHKKIGYVEPARNFAISKATGSWVFVLDADEEITKKLGEKITQILKNPDSDYYRIPRKNIIFGKWIKHSRWWPDYNIRFFRKGFVSWSEIIHTVPVTQGAGGQLAEKEELAIIHHNYENLEQFIERMNKYTTLHAKIRKNEGYKFSWKDLIIKPSNEFFSRYFFGQGYKDGIHGLGLSLLQAFSELTLYLKIWQLENFKDEHIEIKNTVELMRDQEKELHFWQSDAIYKESGNFTDRIRRRFRI